MDVDKFEGGTGRSEDLWMENENIFDRSERSPSVGPSVVLFTDGGREPFFKAADDAIAKRCDALSSHLAAAATAAAAAEPDPIRGDHQFRGKE